MVRVEAHRDLQLTMTSALQKTHLRPSASQEDRTQPAFEAWTSRRRRRQLRRSRQELFYFLDELQSCQQA